MHSASGEPSPDTPAGYVLTTYLNRHVDRLLTEEPRVRDDEEDAVHQMRVAARRLRSSLRTFRPLVDAEWATRLSGELAWLGDSLGESRDLEVLGERLRRGLDRLEEDQVRGNARGRVDRLLAARAEAARSTVVQALASDRYATLLDLLRDAAQTPPTTAQAARRSRDALPAMVRREWRRLTRRANRLVRTEADAADFHPARIAAKRTRYAAETVAPALGAKAVRLARKVEELQDLLGEHQDAVVAARTLSELGAARGVGTAAFTFGVLNAGELSAAAHVRSRFPALWRDVSRKKHRKWLLG